MVSFHYSCTSPNGFCGEISLMIGQFKKERISRRNCRQGNFLMHFFFWTSRSEGEHTDTRFPSSLDLLCSTYLCHVWLSDISFAFRHLELESIDGDLINANVCWRIISFFARIPEKLSPFSGGFFEDNTVKTAYLKHLGIINPLTFHQVE